MKRNKKSTQLEGKLNAYLQLSKSIALSPISDPKTLLPLGAAMFGAMNALDAAIVYSGVQNVNMVLVANGNQGFIDIDGGGNDFRITRNHAVGNVFIQADDVAGGGFAIDGFHGNAGGVYAYPYANAANVVIGAAGPWAFGAGQANTMSELNNAYPGDKWTALANSTTRFLAFRGVKGGITCYGWMRITKNSFGNFTVVDWAYENTGASILTGATSSGAGTADLSLTESASTTTPATGQTVTFTLVLSNAGPNPATNAEIKNIVPSGLTFVPGSMTGPGTYVTGSPAGTGLRWQNLTVPVNGSVTLTFQATVTAPSGNIVNFAEVQSSAEGDPDSTPGNGQ